MQGHEKLPGNDPIPDGLKDESPFVLNMVFCSNHDNRSNVIEVNQCPNCYAPGSRKDPRQTISNAGFGPDYSFQRRSPTITDAIRLIKKIEACDGMPAKLILLRNFIEFTAGRLSDWP